MPNTAVKPANAESTWGEAPWEDRKPLISEKSTGKIQCFFAVSRQQLAFARIQMPLRGDKLKLTASLRVTLSS